MALLYYFPKWKTRREGNLQSCQVSCHEHQVPNEGNCSQWCMKTHIQKSRRQKCPATRWCSVQSFYEESSPGSHTRRLTISLHCHLKDFSVLVGLLLIKDTWTKDSEGQSGYLSSRFPRLLSTVPGRAWLREADRRECWNGWLSSCLLLFPPLHWCEPHESPVKPAIRINHWTTPDQGRFLRVPLDKQLQATNGEREFLLLPGMSPLLVWLNSAEWSGLKPCTHKQSKETQGS